MYGGVLAGCLLTAPAFATEMVFRVEQAGGLDLDAARMAQILAAPETEVRITYAPLLALPGWTGRLGVCGISRGTAKICLKKRWKSAYVRGEKITRSADSLQFRIPRVRWFGLMPYKPAGPVRVSLPAFWPGGLPINMDANVLELTPDWRPVVDMHLPAPYGGVASWQRRERHDPHKSSVTPLPPWQLAACDPSIGLSAAMQPQWRPHRQVEAYAEWLQTLADSEWWAQQIAGVQWQQGEQAGVRWRQVQVQRGHQHLTHLRVEEDRLTSSHCPGQTRYEFTWQEGRLLAARRQESAELFSEVPGCDSVVPVMEEALWGNGQLLRFNYVGKEGQRYRDVWREDNAACPVNAVQSPAAASIPSAPDYLQQAAQHWQVLGVSP